MFNPAELAEIEAYHAPRYVYAAVDLVVWPVLLAVAARFLTRPLWRASERLAAWLGAKLAWARRAPVLRVVAAALDRMWQGPGWGAALLFALLFFELFTLLDLPWDIYFGYVREKQYGMSPMTPGAFAVDWLKGNTFVAVAVSSLAFGLFGLAKRLPAWWWVLGLVSSLVMVGSAAIDPYRARIYVVQEPLADGELKQRITALMEQAHIDFKDVLVDKTSAKTVRLQAYFAGTGPTRTINLNDSLLAALSTDEILAAVAHEAGHVHESRWPARIASALALLAFLYAVERLFRLTARRAWFGVTGRADVRVLPLIVLVFDLAMTAASPVSGALSREREYAADRSAVALTGDPAALRSMLVKAARTNKMHPSPPRWYVLKGMSHPPIGERIDAVGR
ncbi:MAG: M48 family metalloprotease [Deltaproteobacteria bacterium]|nr:M48 family metalloprotease [Deltaproteobacteria bacterium]